jgi:hypothetical protein
LGTQFVLTGEGQAEGHPCLLQRQNKVEVTTKEGDDPHIETLVEGNYYTHGSRMLMALSLLDIVQSRMVRLGEVDALSILTPYAAHRLDAHATNTRALKEDDTLDPSYRLLILSSFVRSAKGSDNREPYWQSYASPNES